MRRFRPTILLAIAVMAVSLVNSRAIAQTSLPAFEIAPAKKEAPDKLRTYFKASRFYLRGATMFDATSTAIVMRHPTVAMRADGSLLAHYYGVETGWAKFLGNRNTGAAVAANLAFGAGVDFASQKLYRKGGRWRYLAIGLNVLKGTDGLIAGIHNARIAGGVDRRIRLVTGYSGPVQWAH